MLWGKAFALPMRVDPQVNRRDARLPYVYAVWEGNSSYAII
jgi:hypothetical protein